MIFCCFFRPFEKNYKFGCTFFLLFSRQNQVPQIIIGMGRVIYRGSAYRMKIAFEIF